MINLIRFDLLAGDETIYTSLSEACKKYMSDSGCVNYKHVKNKLIGLDKGRPKGVIGSKYKWFPNV